MHFRNGSFAFDPTFDAASWPLHRATEVDLYISLREIALGRFSASGWSIMALALFCEIRRDEKKYTLHRHAVVKPLNTGWNVRRLTR